MRKPSSPDFFLPALAAWLAACLVDLGFTTGVPVMSSFWWTIGLAAGCALLTAAGFTAAHLAVSLLPRAVRWGVWLAAGLCVGAWLADELWVFSKIGGKDHGLAVAALALCGVSGLGLGWLAGTIQGGASGARGFLPRLGRLPRSVAAVLLLAAAGGMIFFDRTEYEGLYSEVHLALRLASLFLSAVAALLLWEPFGERIPGSWRWPVACSALAALPVFFTLGESAVLPLSQINSRPYPALALDLMRGVTDIDRDGFSSLLAGGDCAPFDPAIHPAARDIPGNGIDENCFGGDLKTRSVYDASVEQRPGPAEPSPMNVVLITVDAMRSDRLRQAGYKRPVTPRISDLAGESLIFSHAYATGSWTSIAVPTMMRSIFARRLHWTGYIETDKYRLVKLPVEGKLREGERQKRVFLLASHEPRKPLAWWLKQRGMHTIGVVNDGFSRMLSKAVGTGIGFDTFLEVDEDADTERGDAATTDLALDALGKALEAGGEPFFLWVHYFGPHAGRFRPPRKWSKYARIDGNRYDDRLAYCDDQVGRLIDGLSELSLPRPTALIFSADHGEEIRGKKTFHGNSVSEEALRVPLFLRIPGLEHRTIDAAVSTADIVPTVLSLTGTPPLPDLDGVDLLSLARGEPVSRRLGLVADNWKITGKGTILRDQVAVFDGTYKLILNRNTKSFSVECQRPEAVGGGREGVLAAAQAIRHLNLVLEQYLDESEAPDCGSIDGEIDFSYLPIER